jgi:hypothetical protein
MARPTDYSPEIIKKTQLYLDNCVDDVKEFHKTRGDKSDTYERIVNVKIPTIEGLAVYLGITRETIYDWESQESKKEFSYITARLRSQQASELISKGLSGDYNPTIAKVLLTKHGYREGIESTGKDGDKLIPDTINIKDLTNKLNEIYGGRGVTGNGGTTSSLGTEA